ncbi:hypothetical protein ScPMuIL_017372 [Solemya velum]
MFVFQIRNSHHLHRICHRCLKLFQSDGRTFGNSVTNQSSKLEWTSKEIRQAFLDYFCQSRGHIYVPSSSVIPKKGEGTYFTNAGMNQFKPVFLGEVQPGTDMSSYKRVANSQKCVRVGGKHNDLDDVGRDTYHHTFFEMLGNWSFGDYFKEEACAMALELLTKVYGLPLERLYFTYFGGSEELGLQADLECRDTWLQLNVPQNRLLPFGMRDNFWDMGDTGPCGPCTEIHYDCRAQKQSKTETIVNQTEKRYIESIEKGEKVLQKFINKHGKRLTGKDILELHEGKYGSPLSVDIIEDMASSWGVDMDMAGFDELVQQHKYTPPIPKGNMKKQTMTQEVLHLLHSREIFPTDDSFKYMVTGSHDLKTDLQANIVSLIDEGSVVEEVETGKTCGVVMDKTTFYAEAGGQMADRGDIVGQCGRLKVTDVQNYYGYVLHLGEVVEGTMLLGEVHLEIDQTRRSGCMRNHTATHLLNTCLRGLLEDVSQRGSSVEPEKFTFDFSCMSPINNIHIESLERQVMNVIEKSIPVARELIPLKKALERKDVVFLPDEVYPADVRLVSITSTDEGFCFQSSELCGGTHVSNTKDIENFCILKMTGVSQGTKRAVCVTGSEALQADFYIDGKERTDFMFEEVKLTHKDPCVELNQAGKIAIGVLGCFVVIIGTSLSILFFVRTKRRKAILRNRMLINNAVPPSQTSPPPYTSSALDQTSPPSYAVAMGDGNVRVTVQDETEAPISGSISLNTQGAAFSQKI